MALSNSLVWFRRDLRIEDHAALHHALLSSRRVYCAFVFDTSILEGLPADDKRVQFIHASLRELDARLRELGGFLIVRHGRSEDEIPRLARDLSIESVFANNDYEPGAITRDRAVASALKSQGQGLQTFKDQVIFEKDEVLTLGGGHFSVFTPYKNAWLKRLHLTPQAADEFETVQHAASFASPTGEFARMPSLAQIGFSEPQVPVSGAGMRGAEQCLAAFVARLPRYDKERDFPGLDTTSRISVHLRFGTVSIRRLVRLLLQRQREGASGSGDAAWMNELIWRDFYQFILARHPRVVTQSFKTAFDQIQWENGQQADEHFAAWCEGRTGYPLVDAAMNQLNETGFMHNRLRMVTASIAVKHLGLDWRRGERYFARKLLDYDLAANNAGWQWAASTGCDAQPYFRIFNPVTQSKRFDADGVFIRRWLPQLSGLKAPEIHTPWLAAPLLLAAAGITLGRDYPLPIVDHDEARRRTLARFGVLKQD